MIIDVKATNKNTGEVISYKLEGEQHAAFTYEGTHMQEVAENKISEVNNILILRDSPIYTKRERETKNVENMTFIITITED